MFLLLFFYLFPKLANDLQIVISYIGRTLQVLTKRKFLIFVLTPKLKGDVPLSKLVLIIFRHEHDEDYIQILIKYQCITIYFAKKKQSGTNSILWK